MLRTALFSAERRSQCGTGHINVLKIGPREYDDGCLKQSPAAHSYKPYMLCEITESSAFLHLASSFREFCTQRQTPCYVEMCHYSELNELSFCTFRNTSTRNGIELFTAQ